MKPGVETSHLSVESIIRTYADRLVEQEPRRVTPKIITERDELLTWWSDQTRQRQGATEQMARLRAALEWALDCLDGTDEAEEFAQSHSTPLHPVSPVAAKAVGYAEHKAIARALLERPAGEPK